MGCRSGCRCRARPEVRRVATGVSASLELFQRAAQDGADMLIVHHGLFFGSGPRPPLSEQDRDRLKTLFDHDITLAGYHLALDAHPQVGNNAIICDRLGVAKREPFGVHGPHTLGFVGALDRPLSIAQLVERVRAADRARPAGAGARPGQHRAGRGDQRRRVAVRRRRPPRPARHASSRASPTSRRSGRRTRPASTASPPATTQRRCSACRRWEPSWPSDSPSSTASSTSPTPSERLTPSRLQATIRTWIRDRSRPELPAISENRGVT